jgi:hypothetical protein
VDNPGVRGQRTWSSMAVHSPLVAPHADAVGRRFEVKPR